MTVCALRSSAKQGNAKSADYMCTATCTRPVEHLGAMSSAVGRAHVHVYVYVHCDHDLLRRIPQNA